MYPSHKGIEGSLYQATDVKQLMDRLPGWTPIMIMVTRDPYAEMGIADALALVMALDKADEDSLKLAIVIKFESESTAVESADVVRSQLEMAMGAMEIEVSQSGVFVEIEGTVPMQLLE